MPPLPSAERLSALPPVLFGDTIAEPACDADVAPFVLDAASAPTLWRLAARLFADRPAVIAVDATLSHAALDRRVATVAAGLLAAGLRPGDRLGVCLPRTARALVMAQAALRLGVVYVPLLPTYPAARVVALSRSAGLAAIAFAPGAPVPDDLPPGVRALDAEAIERDADDLAHVPGAALPPLPRADERTAYIIHTSGSTGQPKGVEISHAALAHLIAAMRIGPGPFTGDVVLANVSFGFDVSIPDLFAAPAVGATLLLLTDADAIDGAACVDALCRHAVTFIQSTPSRLRLLLGAGWPEDNGSSLRILCGGEPMTPSLVRDLSRRAASVWNGYGPTEATVWATARPLPSDGSDVGIGGPVGDTVLRVVDADGQQTPVGAFGELLIGGPGVALGYVGRPDLTAERFVADADGAVFYRTGDLLRPRADGQYDYGGRNDAQIKLRGVRIEPAEVENALRADPAVAEALVLACGADDEAVLVGYVVGRPDRPRPDPAAVERTAAALLPPLLRPRVVALDAFPLNDNGKIDRARLPAPLLTTGMGGPPRTPTEALIASLWEEGLSIGNVGREDDFLALGGDSLLATAIEAVWSTTVGRRVGVATLIATTRLDQLARHLDHLAGRADTAPHSQATTEIVRWNDEAAGLPVYGLHSFVPFRPLATALRGRHPFRAVALRRDAGLAVRRRGTIGEIAEAYATAIATERGPDRRPVILLGWCGAGPIALAVADALEWSGRPVRSVVLVDPEPTGAAAYWQRCLRGLFRHRPKPKPAGDRAPGSLDEGGFGWMERALARHCPNAPFAPVVIALPAQGRAFTAVLRRAAWRRRLGASTRFVTVPGDHATVFEAGAAELAALIASEAAS